MPGFSVWHCTPFTSTSTTTVLRLPHHLAQQTPTVRDPTTAVARLMAFIPTAVTAGCLRRPDLELLHPGTDFADRVKTALTAAADTLKADDTPTSTTERHRHDLLQQTPR